MVYLSSISGLLCRMCNMSHFTQDKCPLQCINVIIKMQTSLVYVLCCAVFVNSSSLPLVSPSPASASITWGRGLENMSGPRPSRIGNFGSYPSFTTSLCVYVMKVWVYIEVKWQWYDLALGLIYSLFHFPEPWCQSSVWLWSLCLSPITSWCPQPVWRRCAAPHSAGWTNTAPYLP